MKRRKARLRVVSTVVYNRQQIRDSGGYFLLFAFEVRKSSKNSTDYVGGASDHCNDNFHYHESPLQSSIPTKEGLCEFCLQNSVAGGSLRRDNRLEPSASIGFQYSTVCLCDKVGVSEAVVGTVWLPAKFPVEINPISTGNSSKIQYKLGGISTGNSSNFLWKISPWYPR